MLTQIRPAALPAWLATHADANPLVLDVREQWEQQLASLPPRDGLAVVAIPMGELIARVGELEPQRPIACLCHHGIRSMQVARWLLGQGFEEVVNIAGGIAACAHELDTQIGHY